MVIAWRIHLMTRLGRKLPDLPPEILFSDVELRVLALFAKSCRMVPPKNLGDAVFLVARLGGYLKRKRDPPEVMWNGYAQLAAMAHFREIEDEAEQNLWGTGRARSGCALERGGRSITPLKLAACVQAAARLAPGLRRSAAAIFSLCSEI